MVILQTTLLTTIQLLLLVVGSNKVAALLFQDYATPKPSKSPVYLTHVLFSLSLSCSCTLFLLVFAGITKLFDKRHVTNTPSLVFINLLVDLISVLDYFWKFNLNLLLLLVIIVIPWFQLYTFLHLTRGIVLLGPCLINIYI
jgi:hypothetical protein